MRAVRIGCGAGFADDRIEPAVELVARGKLDYLVFECLAERTIALAQLEKLQDPDAGYNEWLAERIEAVLEPALANHTRIITNMGAANPVAAGRLVKELAARKGFPELKVAVIDGDDVRSAVAGSEQPLTDRDGTVADLGDAVISANAYLGADALAPALASDAEVIITGRVADPSLFLAPLVHELGWAADDWRLIGTGTCVGHLLECGAHVTGGYFADPPAKPVPDLARVGMPLAEVCADGSFTVTKTPGSGGVVNVATVTEQLLYEIHDPACYLTPDVSADFSAVTLEQRSPDVVAVSGTSGVQRPAQLKVSVGYTDGYVGEGQISYAGPNALARGRLALELVRDRLAQVAVPLQATRYELIGVDSVHCGAGGAPAGEPPEVRVRVAAKTAELRDARRVGHEVSALWLNGPAGGGGAFRQARRSVAIASVLIPRSAVQVTTTYLGGH